MHLVFDFKPPKTQLNWSLLAKNMVNRLKFLVLHSKKKTVCCGPKHNKVAPRTLLLEVICWL